MEHTLSSLSSCCTISNTSSCLDIITPPLLGDPHTWRGLWLHTWNKGRSTHICQELVGLQQPSTPHQLSPGEVSRGDGNVASVLGQHQLPGWMTAGVGDASPAGHATDLIRVLQ